MDPIYKFPASPGTPLFPISPERANRQLPTLPHSPSLPSIKPACHDPFLTHSRGNSDVQGKVAQFNNLTKEAVQRRKDNEAALKRAVLGREEAEGESRRLRDDNSRLRQDVEEGRARERRVGERLEGVMEELQRAKETHTHTQGIYEKEVRRARKEAFKSSSALVQLQEQLKCARNKFTLMREEVDVQRRKVDAKEQEKLAAQHQLVELQEELHKLKQQNKSIEAERDALKTTLEEEEVACIAAKGAIALPPSREGEEFSSPRMKNHYQRRESLKENIDPEVPEIVDELLLLREELRIEKRMRLRADDQVHFMKMECQFQCCSCRVAERQGTEYVHDDSLANQKAKMASKIADEHIPPYTHVQPERKQQGSEAPTRQLSLMENSESVNFCSTTGTFHRTPSPAKPSPSSQLLEKTPPPPPQPAIQSTTSSETPSFTFPVTPRPLPMPPGPPRTISHTTTTTTMTVPLKSDDFFSPAPATPGGISREAALEQIRQRRGRARSLAQGNGTPRRKLVETGVVGLRREFSAPSRV